LRGRQNQESRTSKYGLARTFPADGTLKRDQWTRRIGFSLRYSARRIICTTRTTGLLLLRADHLTRGLPGRERNRRNDQRNDHCDGNPDLLKLAEAHHAAAVLVIAIHRGTLTCKPWPRLEA